MRPSLFVLPAVATAYPGLQQHNSRRGLADTVLNDIQSLGGSLASSVDPANKRPEAGYEFQEPGPNDSRGPCPGLNLLANYGYLPHDGHVTAAQVIEAVSRGFNMGADLATILSVFAVLTDGDIATESWYLGSGPGNVGGLNRHSTVEADISVNKEDYYNGCGDNHHISSSKFKQNVQFASQEGGFTYAAMRKQFEANSKFTQANNPFIYYFPFPSIVSVVAFNFYSEYFSNGTYGSGGDPNYESISTIVGAKYDENTGNFQYVPERWPENWYRRSTEYGAVQALTDGFTRIYPVNPVSMPIGQLGTNHINVTNILCDAYQGFGSVVPLKAGGGYEDANQAISWAVQQLANVGLDGSVLGCPKTTISPNEGTQFFYPNASQPGGPEGTLPSQQKWAGNNVYYKTYFCTPPEKPSCNHEC